MVDIILTRPNVIKYSNMPPDNHPLGLLYISAYLKQYNYIPKVIDQNYETFKLYDAKIVGISMLSYCRKEPYELINTLKKNNPNVKIVLGGIHASALPKLLIDNLNIDAIVIGEGEESFKELCDLWINNIGTLKDIKGIATKEFGIHTKRELLDINSLPIPDYEQTNFKRYYAAMAKNHPNDVYNGIRLGDTIFANLITSRGCMGRCTFCNAFKHWAYKIRFRKSENVVKELIYLRKKYGVNMFVIHDDSFGQDNKQSIEICKGIINSGYNFVWYTSMRIDCVTPELLKWMKRAGCLSIAYGVESGSPKILKLMGKQITINNIINSIRLTKEAGINAYALMMIGNKGENDSTIEESYQLLKKIKPNLMSVVGRVMVTPDTHYNAFMNIDDNYWLSPINALPTFYDKFNDNDLKRWFNKLTSLPQNWNI